MLFERAGPFVVFLWGGVCLPVGGGVVRDDPFFRFFCPRGLWGGGPFCTAVLFSGGGGCLVRFLFCSGWVAGRWWGGGELLPGANPAREIPDLGTACRGRGFGRLWRADSDRTAATIVRSVREKGRCAGIPERYLASGVPVFSILILGCRVRVRTRAQSSARKHGGCDMSNSQRALPMR